MLKNIKWVVKNIVLGLVLLFAINFAGVNFNINIPVNVITVLVAGFLRIPGVVVLVVLSKL